MFVGRRPGWRLPDKDATPEAVFWSRREALALTAFAGLSALARPQRSEAAAEYPPLSGRFGLSQPLTAEKYATSYNNYYEFDSGRARAPEVGSFKTKPWRVLIDGLVEKAQSFDLDDLLCKVTLEERLYRHRCVEGWAMAVPWIGFPLKELVDLARPLGSAKYLRLESFMDPEKAPGQKQFWYPWPYVEALTIAEADNELSFLVTGAYGKALSAQNGAPLRLATPWKYGFKSIKSIVRFSFTEDRPITFWERQQPQEYGFWANVNPDVSHPRWSQAWERLLGTDERRPTKIWNGYGDYVASIYAALDKEPLFK
jgi:sulfoxide reductase catalytic subunit YedY